MKIPDRSFWRGLLPIVAVITLLQFSSYVLYYIGSHLGGCKQSITVIDEIEVIEDGNGKRYVFRVKTPDGSFWSGPVGETNFDPRIGETVVVFYKKGLTGRFYVTGISHAEPQKPLANQ